MTENNSDQTTEANVDIKELREAAERGKQSQARAEQLERQVAFMKAGVDPDDPRAKYLYKGYEGDLTPDAIRAEAQAAGVLAEPGPTQEQQQSLAGQMRIQQVAAQAQPVGSEDYNAQLEQAMKDGGVAGLITSLNSMGVPISED